MLKLTSALVALAVLSITPVNVAAQKGAEEDVPVAAAGPVVGLVLEGGVEMGGDVVGETVFEDGDTQTMRAGQGGSAAVGLEVRPSAASPFAVRATVGYKYVTTAADNANITLTRFPIELVATYRLPQDFWVGAGYVRHTGVRFRGDGWADDIDFDDANGGTIEAGWRWLAVSYTVINYQADGGIEMDASSGGISVMGILPLR